MATKRNIPSVKSGDTWEGMRFQLTLPDDSPVILTGSVIRMQIRQYNDSRSATKSWSTEDGSILIEEGGAWVTFPRTVMNVPVFKYRYDVEIAFVTGRILTILEGYFPVTSDVTR